MSPKVPLIALLATLPLVGCNREKKVVTASRPARVAPPTANDILSEKHDELVKDLEPIPPLGAGVNFQTPDGENWVKYPSGLLIHELKPTQETQANYGQRIALAYTLTSPGVSKPIEKYGPGNPFTFNLGSKTVVKGLNMGVLGMHIGSRRRVFLPPELAFGKAGNPMANIDPDQALIYEIELISVTGEPVQPPAPLPIPAPIGPQPPTPATTHPADRADPPQ